VFQTVEELVARVGERRVVDGDCWLYRGRHTAKGYPQMNRKKVSRSYVRVWTLHRLACAVSRGLDYDDPSWHALHTCNRPGCWNPDHVRPGDNDQNLRDAGRVLVKDHHEYVMAARARGDRLVDIAAAIGVQHPAVCKYLRRHPQEG
jgi:hypothetical protein